jgi:hypothetical protein
VIDLDEQISVIHVKVQNNDMKNKKHNTPGTVTKSKITARLSFRYVTFEMQL